jgi:hypothetical protein
MNFHTQRSLQHKPDSSNNLKTTRFIVCYASILCGTMLLASCISASVGRSFPSASVAGLEVGTTTKAQVLQQFGPPYERIDTANWRIMHFGDDETALILRYVYSHANLFQGADRSLQTMPGCWLITFTSATSGRTEQPNPPRRPTLISLLRGLKLSLARPSKPTLSP